MQCFCGRQFFLDATLIANEIVDLRRKQGESGIFCKLDPEKAYDYLTRRILISLC